MPSLLSDNTVEVKLTRKATLYMRLFDPHTLPCEMKTNVLANVAGIIS